MSVINKQDELYGCEKRCISSPPSKRARNSTETCSVNILDVLDVDICRRAILSFLPLAELLRSECVCQRWRDVIAKYIQGAGRFHFRFHVVTPWHQPVLPPDCRALPLDETPLENYARNLYKWGKSVEAAPCSADSFAIVIEHCPNLQELTIYGIPDQDTVKDYLEKLLKLKRLGFRDPHPQTGTSAQLKDNSIEILLENVTSEELNIAGVEQLTGACFNKLKTNLTCLRLQNCPALECNLLKTGLDRLRVLKTLELTGLSSEILQNIHVLLDNMDKLERLELCRYGEVEIVDLSVLKQMKNLKHLNLSHNRAVDDDWLRAVAVGSKLESLDVSYCHGVSMSGLESVCRACARTMRGLAVSGQNHLNNEHIETLIRLCPYLSVLNAQECKGLSRVLVCFLTRLMRRRNRHRLPVLRLRLYGIKTPCCMMRNKSMLDKSLILDFSKDAQLPETFESDELLTSHFPAGMLLSNAR